MKLKLTVLAALLGLSALASADTSFLYSDGRQTDNATHALTNVSFFNFRTSVVNGLAADLVIINKQADETNLVTNRTELGLIASTTVLGVTPFVRGAVAEKQKSGVNSFAYYVAEPGVSVQLPAGFSAKVSYMYRNAFQQANNDLLNEYRASIGYDVTKATTVVVGALRDASGFSPASTNYVGVSYKF